MCTLLSFSKRNRDKRYPNWDNYIYRVPLDYRPDATRPLLHVMLVRDQIIQVRASETDGQSWPQKWIYDGPMALRGEFEQHP